MTSDSVADSAPLESSIARFIDAELVDRVAVEYRKGRRLFVSTTNLDEQRPVVWDMGAIAASGRPDRLELFRKVLLASAAIPAFLPPVYMRVEAEGKSYDEMHVDGGVSSQLCFAGYMLNLAEARHAAGMQVPIRVYVVHNGTDRPEREEVPASLKGIAVRAVATLIKSQGVSDAYRVYAFAMRDGIDFSCLGIPDSFRRREADGLDSIDRGEMNRLFDLGFAMGRGEIPWRKKPKGL
jgi:predicted acylesterase/phospholipase RssA